MADSPLRFATSFGRRLIERHTFKKLAGLGALLALLLIKEAPKLMKRNAFVTKAHGSEDDVRRTIEEYLAGRISLEELDTWLTQRTWDAERVPSMAHHAELLIAEAVRGDREDLAEDLRLLAASKRADPVAS